MSIKYLHKSSSLASFAPYKREVRFSLTSLLFCVEIRGREPTNRKVCLGSSASELRAKELSMEQVKLVKRKSVDPLNASEQDKSTAAHIKKDRIYTCPFLYLH